MNTKLVAFLSACAVAGALHADALTVTRYDFNSLLVSGAGAGAATMTINGAPVTTTKLGDNELLATGLSAGNVYKYEVTLGGNTTRGEVTMGNRTGKLFGADATATPDVSCGSWNTTAPYVAPTVEANEYVLQGASNKFDVTENLMSGKKIVYIDSTMTFADGADELDENLTALGAFTLAQLGETSDAYSWVGLTGGTTKWVTLTGDITAAPATYVSRMEFDFNTTPAQVRYLVGSSASNLIVLKDGSGNEWFPVAANATSVSSVAFEGTGSYTKLEGSSINANVAEVGGTEYANIADALTSQKTGATVTLLTNTRPEANAALVDGRWTIINESNYSFKPYDATGYAHTYSEGTFAVSTFVTCVDVSGATGPFGCDFTNGVLNVTLANAQIQSGAPVTLEVTVKDASGGTVASATYSNITGDTQETLAFPAAAGTIVAKGEYTYEIVAKKGDEQIATATGAFRAGNLANWFSASSANWADNGAWSTNRQPVTVTGDKLALGGNTWDFTPVEPSVSNAIVRVDTVIEIDGAIDNDDLPTEADVQGMITLAETSAASETPVWKAYNGTEWLSLTGGETTPGTYTVRAEFDYTRSPKAVRYSVAPANGPFVVLKNGTEEWIANGVSTATTLARTSAYGVGNLVSLKGDNIDAFVAEANGVGYESLAAALAAGDEVKLLWDCTWTPGRAGSWAITANDKTLTLLGADGWDTDYQSGILQASDTQVAAIGETPYYLLTKAFADVQADGTTVTLLTNVVQDVDIALANNANLDLAGWFVSGAAKFVPADSKALTVTNTTDDVGGFGLAVSKSADVVAKGGKWKTDVGVTAGDGYKFFSLAEPIAVDGVTYAYEAVHTTVEPSQAKVYPVVDGSGESSVAEAVVTDDFVSTYCTEKYDPAKIAKELNAPRTTGNGLPLIQSYVLGLTPTVENSKPVVSTTQAAATDKISLSLGSSVQVNANAGVKVRYSLSTAATSDFTGAATTDPQDSPNFEAAVPSSDDPKVKYYKINIIFGK